MKPSGRRGLRPKPARATRLESRRQLVKRLPTAVRFDAARGELAAGGVDVAPARAADERAHALRFEHGLKRRDALVRRGAVGQLVRWVVRDEVDLGPQGVAVEESREPPRVLVRVVGAGAHDVLEGEALAGFQRFLELLAGVEQLGERFTFEYV